MIANVALSIRGFARDDIYAAWSNLGQLFLLALILILLDRMKRP
ncbi:hypothetical protein [Deinococcus yavapaiensis]|uniref:Uncharacterized protein n=1 Tax=Deinococcus yavapaiensis KR-236 TaxID=694435 RepID=A0A318S5H6_9DEIO|nr:hypothetical protein [Deinococcus yavapaiensis]PYE49412.1 hypothetical protein DES52_1236 [Deinococcus yavapaiensis KR-236]